jgi:hypothetical protein
MSYQEDRDFEKRTRGLFQNVVDTIFVPGGQSQFNDGCRLYDQHAGIDMITLTPSNQRLTWQLKARRYPSVYEFMNKYNKSLILGLYKLTTDGQYYAGDYNKCLAIYFMYGFLNKDENKLLLWLIINYSLMKEKIASYGGWEKCPGIKKNMHNENKKEDYYITIPFHFYKECVVSCSSNPKSLVDNYHIKNNNNSIMTF